MGAPHNRSEEPTTVAATDTQPASDRVLWIFGEGVSVAHPLPPTGAIVIGRAADAEARVDSAVLSRRHARLHLDDSGTLRLEDLDSANGTRVADRALQPYAPIDIEAGEVFDLGSLHGVVQARRTGQPTTRLKRILSHGYFELRLEEECVRAAGSGATFAVASASIRASKPSGETPSRTVALEVLEPALYEIVGPLDAIGRYAPGTYEILLSGADRARSAKATLADLGAALGARGIDLRSRVVEFPRDGRSAEALIAAVHGSASESTAPGVDAKRVVIADDSMRQLHRLVERVARSNVTVLVIGETGAGKEIVAERIHRLSPRAERPFLRLNCGGFTEALLESELFGHEKGAFTGAAQAKPGLLEVADGGTVFLDEVGELPPSMQVKLLRVLEDREVRRVGAIKSRTIDVRFVAATNRDLEAEIASRRFREDLYYRLSGFVLRVPPLRDRRAEIPAFARAFLEIACAASGRPHVPELSAEALDLLGAYRWPGNLRELRNVIDRALILCDDDAITPEHLPVDKMGTALDAGARAAADVDAGLKGDVAKLERERIVEALEASDGNQTRAAKRLGISRGTLLARMDAFGLDRPRRGKPR